MQGNLYRTLLHKPQDPDGIRQIQLLRLSTDPFYIPEFPTSNSFFDAQVARIIEMKRNKKGIEPKIHSSFITQDWVLDQEVVVPAQDLLDIKFDFIDTIEDVPTAQEASLPSRRMDPGSKSKCIPQKRPVQHMHESISDAAAPRDNYASKGIAQKKPAQEINEPKSDFMSAREKLIVDSVRLKRPLGLTRTSSIDSQKKFVSPLLSKKEEPVKPQQQADPKLKNVDPLMVETIMNEIMSQSDSVSWDDIAGLEHAKNSIREIVVWPMLRPDIFTGIRGPPKGLLLFGPPGTGKTLIGKCIASQCNATFFSISSSILTSKWVGDGEKMVKALFAVARAHQPSVIFIDEIDSLLTQRTDGEVEATRRIKTEFLVQFDGCGTSSDDRILMIGATNRPHEIDEAARRRFRKKLYIPLPEAQGRQTIMLNLLSKQTHCLSTSEIDDIVTRTDGYSGSDMDGLVREAALGPIRDITDISKIDAADVRPITHQDFIKALSQVRASVSKSDLDLYLKFEKSFGSLSL